MEIHQAPAGNQNHLSQEESQIADNFCNGVANSLRGSPAIKSLVLQLGDGIER